MTGNESTGIVVQPRDRRLFQELDILRVADREQVKLLAGFRSTTRANTRLLLLSRAGLLRRTFIGTIGSGHKALYTLSPKAAALIGARLPTLPFRPADKLVGSPFLLHQLKINEVYLTVKYRPLPAGARFRRWLTFREPLSPTLPLIPDGYCELELAGAIHPVFIEVDLGTEDRSVWQKKFQFYLQLAISGQFERMFGQPRFRVLAITTTERRVANIRTAAAKLTDKVFWFSSFETISRDGFWSSVWLRPTGDQRQPLI